MKLKPIYEDKTIDELMVLSGKAGICPFSEVCPDDLLEEYDTPEEICPKCLTRHFYRQTVK